VHFVGLFLSSLLKMHGPKKQKRSGSLINRGGSKNVRNTSGIVSLLKDKNVSHSINRIRKKWKVFLCCLFKC